MLANEKQFFESVYSLGAKGWNVEISPGRVPGDAVNEPLDVFLYLVDTSCNWLAVGCMSSAAFSEASLVAQNHDVDEQALGAAAAQAMALAAQVHAGGTIQSQLNALLTLVAAALKTTNTYALAGKENPAGHWLYIAYRVQSGEMLCRPALIREVQSWLLPPDRLRSLVRKIVQHDQSPQNRNSILRGEGLVELHPAYRV